MSDIFSTHNSQENNTKIDEFRISTQQSAMDSNKSRIQIKDTNQGDKSKRTSYTEPNKSKQKMQYNKKVNEVR